MGKNKKLNLFFKAHPELKIEQEILDKLITEAIAAREKAYTPYSHYKVGAAVLCKSGNIYGGFNVENVSYTLAVHAEKVAILHAILAGEREKHGRKFIKTLAVVHKGDSMPCGLCRQEIKEFCDDALVINANLKGEFLGISCLSELLPSAFGPGHLGIK